MAVLPNTAGWGNGHRKRTLQMQPAVEVGSHMRLPAHAMHTPCTRRVAMVIPLAAEGSAGRSGPMAHYVFCFIGGLGGLEFGVAAGCVAPATARNMKLVHAWRTLQPDETDNLDTAPRFSVPAEARRFPESWSGGKWDSAKRKLQPAELSSLVPHSTFTGAAFIALETQCRNPSANDFPALHHSDSMAVPPSSQVNLQGDWPYGGILPHG